MSPEAWLQVPDLPQSQSRSSLGLSFPACEASGLAQLCGSLGPFLLRQDSELGDPRVSALP